MYSFDFLDGFFAADIVEGCFATHQFEGEYPDTPNIHPAVVGVAFDDFWADVVEGTAVGLPAVLADGCPAEIAYFTHTLH
jgi:hypothetical protein